MATRTSLDDTDRALLQAPNFAHLSTLRADGTILTAPVWVDVDGDEVVVNSETKRAWPQNLRERGTVTVSVLNQENPYQYVAIDGHLASETTDGADAHIDALAKQYIGEEKYPYHQPGDERVIFRIAVDKVLRNR